MPLPDLLKSRRRTKKEDRRLKSFHSVNWREPQDIVDFIMGMWDTRRQRRWWLERTWYTNISFFLGHQWVEWNATNGTLYQPKVPRWRVRLVANLLQGVSRKIVAMVLAQRPIWTALPATGEPQDAVVARTLEKLVKYYWSGPLEADIRLVDALGWMTTTGLGVWRAYWDPMKSSEMMLAAEDVEDKSLIGNLKQLEIEGKNRVNLGDLVLESKSPFQIDPDPWCTDFSSLPWVIETTMRSVEWVHDHYPKTGKDVEADDTENLNFFERRIADLAGPNQRHFGGSASGSADSSKQNMVNLHELHALPFGKYRRGIYAVVAGDTLLDIRYNRWRSGGQIILPYAFMEEIKVPGRLWPTCALEQGVSLQAEYNKGRSQIVENRNLMSRPKWFVAKGAGIGDEALTSEPGEVVYHAFAHMPVAWVPPPLPPYVLRTLELARQDIQDATMIHEVSQAKAPTGIKSGRAILALQEQDQTVIGPMIMRLEHGISKLGSAMMECLSRNATEERIVKIAGKNELYEVEEFIGSDLIGKNKDRPGVNYFDVRIKLHSQLPLTPDARRQAITELVSGQVLNPQTDRDLILEMLELGTDEPLYDTARMDRSNQRKENKELMAGKLMQVQDYDNDLVHIEVMEQHQKSPEYADRRTEKSIAAFNDHKRQHLTNAQAKRDGTFQIPETELPPGEEDSAPAENPLEQIALARLLEGPALPEAMPEEAVAEEMLV